MRGDVEHPVGAGEYVAANLYNYSRRFVHDLIVLNLFYQVNLILYLLIISATAGSVQWVLENLLLSPEGRGCRPDTLLWRCFTLSFDSESQSMARICGSNLRTASACMSVPTVRVTAVPWRSGFIATSTLVSIGSPTNDFASRSHALSRSASLKSRSRSCVGTEGAAVVVARLLA